MFSDLLATATESTVDYPISDSKLPFSDYIAKTKSIVTERRTDLEHVSTATAERIIDANSPYELYPTNPIQSGNKLKYGILLIHGLLDSPFSLREIGNHLQDAGMLVRSILLPGHGTNPADLLNVSYHDWLQAVRYGVNSLRDEVESIYLVGYSTGAALSVYQALQDNHIAGILLLSPAISIKAPVDAMVWWHQALAYFQRGNQEWLHQEAEIDYVKYLSLPFNPVSQVSKLTAVIKEMREHHTLKTPMFMVVSREDETISSDRAIQFFCRSKNAENRMLFYTSVIRNYTDSRIITRSSIYPELNIHYFSHVCIPFSPANSHYGQHGDYSRAARIDSTERIYGAYNYVELKLCRFLHKIGLMQKTRHELTYNPDFDFMAKKMAGFILREEKA
jgi:esterase/lipase